jgi:ketosteroid isomerase-like protein
MSLLRLALLMPLLVACGAARQNAAPPPGLEADVQAAQEIMKLEEEWGVALSRRDTAFFSRILADEFVTTGGEAIRTKQEVIKELGSGTGPLAAPRLQSTRVRVYGDVAVITGLVRFNGPAGGAASPTRFTEVWVKRNGNWQAVHGHYNPVAPEVSP